MATKKFDEEEFLKLKEIENNIAAECKKTVMAVNAWRYLILWLSSFGNSVLPGKGDANHYLSPQQSSEFAFSYDEDQDPDVFVLLAQNKIYECLCAIGVKCAIVEDDGIILIIRDLDINGYFISGVSIKIQCSLALSERLVKIKKHCKEFQIGLISGKFNPSEGRVLWNVSDIYDVNLPIAKTLRESKIL